MSWRGDPDGPLAVMSETLGLELRFENDRMRLWDPTVQEYLLEQHEERVLRIAASAKLMEESAKRIAAERQTHDLESEVADLKERLRRKP